MWFRHFPPLWSPKQVPLCCSLKPYKGSSYYFWKRKLTYHFLVHLLHLYKKPSWEHVLYTPGPHTHKTWSLKNRNVYGGLLTGKSRDAAFPLETCPNPLYRGPFLRELRLCLRPPSPLPVPSATGLSPGVLFSSLFRYVCLSFMFNTFLASDQNCFPRSLNNLDILIVTLLLPLVSEGHVFVYPVPVHNTLLSSPELRSMSSRLWYLLSINVS